MDSIVPNDTNRIAGVKAIQPKWPIFDRFEQISHEFSTSFRAENRRKGFANGYSANYMFSQLLSKGIFQLYTLAEKMGRGETNRPKHIR